MYFAAPNLALTLDRVEPLQRLVRDWGLSLPDVALRFILAHPAVTTTIPGMRRTAHVESNLAASDAPRLDAARLEALTRFRWDRRPDSRA
jgi:aryl-alcohol dehydrogenase-like predicted oxidoreductase